MCLRGGETFSTSSDNVFPAHKLPEILQGVPDRWHEREQAHDCVPLAREKPVTLPDCSELVGITIEFNNERVVKGQWCEGCALQARVLKTRACPDGQRQTRAGELCVEANLGFFAGVSEPRWARLVLHGNMSSERGRVKSVKPVISMPHGGDDEEKTKGSRPADTGVFQSRGP